jgi:diphthamide biosynthesis protein 7
MPPNRRGKPDAELNIGGGVWRLKFLSADPIVEQELGNSGRVLKVLVLASCMHAGARVLEVTGKCRAEGEWEWMIDVLGSVTAHESMCYGCDVQPLDERVKGGGSTHGKRVCVSTSFYDRLLCVWSFDMAAVEVPKVTKNNK